MNRSTSSSQISLNIVASLHENGLPDSGVMTGAPVGNTGIEQLQHYTAHLEGMITRKNEEINRLQGILSSRIAEEKQRHAMHEQIMVQQARKAAMGELLGVVAHKWRQPLSTISLLIQNLKDAWEYDEFDEELLQQATVAVIEQVTHLSQTIDEFRSYLAPAQCADFFSPKQCVKDAAILLSNCFAHFAAIEIQEDDRNDDILVVGSHYGFQQVLHNLLRNANDAVQERQRANTANFSGKITISFTHTNSELVITVADNGGGIDTSVKEHIFDPLFTTKQKNNELGIGLYVSRVIVENSMGGKLWCENGKDGALFFIRLPIATAERRQP